MKDLNQTGEDEVKAVRLLEETATQGHHQNTKSGAASSAYSELFTFADKKDWLLMSIAIFFSIGNGVSIVFYALPLKQLINAFAANSAKQDIVNATLKSVYGFLFNSLIVFVNCWFMTAAWTITSERQMNRARKMYLDSLLKQEIGWHDQQRPAQICSKMQSQISKVQEGLVTNMTSVLNKLSMGVSGIVFALAVGYEMSLVMIGFLPIMMISGCIRGYYTKQKDMYVQTEKIRIDSDVIEVFDNIKTVKMLRGEQYEIERYRKQLCSQFESNWSHGYKGSLAFTFFFFCIIANYALGFWEGAHLVSNRVVNKNTGNPYQVGEVIVIFFTLYLSNLNLCGLPDCLASFSVSRYSMKQIIDVVNRETQMKDGYLEMPSKIKQIAFKGVWFGYGMPLFEGLNLTIGKGITVFVGESGCGKTTIISLLMRFYDVLEGSLLFVGEKKSVDVTDIRSQSLRQEIGYVGQEPVLIGNTFRQVLMAESLSDSQIYEVLQILKADQFVRKMGLYSTVKQLSGGQKQRLAIARALLKKPKILILDESTSALDNRTQKFVLEGIKKQSIDFIIMIAHRKETLVYADRVIRFGKGKVIDEGSLTELMERGVEEEFIQEKANSKGTSVDVVKKQELKQEKTDEALQQQKGDAKKLNFRMSYIMDLMKLNQEKWYLYVLGILGAVYFGTIFPIFSYLISRIIYILQNISIASEETYPFYQDEALNLSNILFIISIGSLLFTTLRYLCFQFLTEKVGFLTKLNAFSKFIKSNYSQLQNNPQQFSYVVTKNCEDLKQVAGNFIPAILQNLVTLVVGLGISAYFSWQITLVFLAILPLLLLSSKAMMAFNHGMHSNTQELHLKTTPLLLETLTNLRTVRSCNLSQKISSKYQIYLAQALSYSIKAGNLSGILFGIGQTLISLCLGVIFLFGAYLIQHEIIDVRDMYTAIFGVMFAGVQAGGNLHFLNMVGKGKVGVCVYFEKVCENEGSVFIDSGYSSNGGDSAELEDADFSVCIDNLSFGYPGKDLLFKDFNLQVRNGQKIGIVGESGCGKSTLVGLLFGLYEAKGGIRVNWRGKRQGLGVVMQEPVLFNRSIYENIRYNCDQVKAEEIEQVCKDINCYNFITDPNFNPSSRHVVKEEFGIREGLNEGFGKSVGARGCYLSGGQRQRIAIARALVRKPKILVLDEATSALDCENEQIIKKTMEETDATQIIIAHRISTIMKCDRIIVLKEGRIVEEGTFKELIGRGGYFNELTQKHSDFI